MKPNFIIIMTDQQRADLRKAAGYSLDTMPFLDSWGGGGVDFIQAYTPNPACMPARVSMFTGRFSQTHRSRTNKSKEDALYTKDMLDIMKEQGYVTALCGKNHSHRDDKDFDVCFPSGHTNFPNPITQEEADFNKFMDATRFSHSTVISPGDVTLQFPYRNVTQAFDFIDNRTGGKPFFLWLSFAEPHNPYQVPKPYYDMFPPESLPAVHSHEELAKKGPKFSWIYKTWGEVLGKDRPALVERMRSNYHGMLRLLDDQLKRLINGLDERSLTENTVIVFISDHGDFAGEYGLMRKGPELPQVLTHIPMIWRGPGIKAQGSLDGFFVNIVDIFPTVCDIIGTEIPYGCQGKSILPLLTGENIPPHEYETAYCESGIGGLYWDDNDTLTYKNEGGASEKLSLDELNSWTQGGQVRMLRKGDYKIQVDMMGSGYLYNVRKDPCEINNLWNDASLESVKMDMMVCLCAAMMRNTDDIPAAHRQLRVKTHPKRYWEQPYRETKTEFIQTPPLWEIARKK